MPLHKKPIDAHHRLKYVDYLSKNSLGNPTHSKSSLALFPYCLYSFYGVFAMVTLNFYHCTFWIKRGAGS